MPKAVSLFFIRYDTQFATRNVRYWHKADNSTAPAFVRYCTPADAICPRGRNYSRTSDTKLLSRRAMLDAHSRVPRLLACHAHSSKTTAQLWYRGPTRLSEMRGGHGPNKANTTFRVRASVRAPNLHVFRLQPRD